MIDASARSVRSEGQLWATSACANTSFAAGALLILKKRPWGSRDAEKSNDDGATASLVVSPETRDLP